MNKNELSRELTKIYKENVGLSDDGNRWLPFQIADIKVKIGGKFNILELYLVNLHKHPGALRTQNGNQTWKGIGLRQLKSLMVNYNKKIDKIELKYIEKLYTRSFIITEYQEDLTYGMNYGINKDTLLTKLKSISKDINKKHNDKFDELLDDLLDCQIRYNSSNVEYDEDEMWDYLQGIENEIEELGMYI